MTVEDVPMVSRDRVCLAECVRCEGVRDGCRLVWRCEGVRGGCRLVWRCEGSDPADAEECEGVACV